MFIGLLNSFDNVDHSLLLQILSSLGFDQLAYKTVLELQKDHSEN